jgi:hypothetical protein
MSGMDADKLSRRTRLSVLMQLVLEDEPDLAHFEHKLTGQFV